ncbi:hypothetical protein [Micromonospora chokoriensis]|uniref:hypothetical protein n=1 Tax=Micromonospora chokoriensis TaxID=356851 RepID=UPI0004C3075D|nr:hypothetical protein [Micromonospora chokoriensis]
MEYRVDLYAAGDVFARTERFVARHHTEAVDTARGLAVAYGLDHARVFVTDGAGQAQFLIRVGAER